MGVTEKDRKSTVTPPKNSRAERLGEQLRANLKRRKAGRGSDMAPEPPKLGEIPDQDGS